MARGQQQLVDAPAHIGLGAAGEALAHDPAHRLVSGGSGRAQPIDLLGLLDAPHGTDRRRCVDQLGGVEQGAQPEHEARPHLVLQPDAQRPAQAGADEAERVVGLVPRHDLQALRQRPQRVAGERLLEAWQDQRRRPLHRQDEAGQPLQQRGVVAEQVLVVGRWRDEQRTDPSRGRLGGGAQQPIGVDGVGEAGSGGRDDGHRATGYPIVSGTSDESPPWIRQARRAPSGDASGSARLASR